MIYEVMLMSIVKVTPISNVDGLFNRLINSTCFLKFNGSNIETNYIGELDAKYLTFQYQVMREYAKNSKKKVQAHHLIFSFSQDEFDIKQGNLDKQAMQALELVDTFLKSYLPSDAQYLELVRSEAETRLYVSVVINSVQVNGKVIDTNLYSVNTLRKSFDNYMTENFEKITGKKFVPVVPNKDNLVNSKTVQIDKRGGYVWKEDLKSRILKTVNLIDNFADFEKILSKDFGVEVKRRLTTVDGNIDSLRCAFIYTFVDRQGDKHTVRDYIVSKNGTPRGLGRKFTPMELERIYSEGKS